MIKECRSKYMCPTWLDNTVVCTYVILYVMYVSLLTVYRDVANSSDGAQVSVNGT